MGVLTRAVLVFEALIILLAIPVALRVDHRGSATTWLLVGLALAALVGVGLLRRPAGLVIGSLVQVAVLAGGLMVPALAVIGAVFAALWVAAIVVGRRGEAVRVARFGTGPREEPLVPPGG